jgi:WhiB family redox-sensing transcriptional regulator
MLRSEIERWRKEALCLGLDIRLFFPGFPADDEEGKLLKQNYPPQIRQLCRECPVNDECLEEALKVTSTSGLWADTSPRQRTQIRRQRTAA